MSKSCRTFNWILRMDSLAKPDDFSCGVEWRRIWKTPLFPYVVVKSGV
jgi:hypothetical protein